MQTNIHTFFKAKPEVEEAEAILRSCVHCGFCNATCPTYQLLGDERDGPRGRIYLLKQYLETNQATEKTRVHLDRCLTCLACETTCPSGVQYGRLADIGKSLLEQQLPRRTIPKAIRWFMRQILPYPKRFGVLLNLGKLFKPLLPSALRSKLPETQSNFIQHQTVVQHAKSISRQSSHQRTMLLLAGCVQSNTAPEINQATSRVLRKLGINAFEVDKAGCCGAMSYHLSAHEEAKSFMRRNIDAWWPHVEKGAETIVMTASGCGTTVKEYGDILKHDPRYAEKAKRISELTKDLSEVLAQEDLGPLSMTNLQEKIAVHCPCSLQHGQQQGQGLETLLDKLGVSLVQTKEKHLCCGSAGAYSLLQPQLSQQLLERKLLALTGDKPTQIVTANIGCQLHLQSQANVAVKHWIQLLDH